MSHDLKYTTQDGQQITPRNGREWFQLDDYCRPLAARQAAVEQVPEHLRDIVKTMLHIAWNHPARRTE